MSEHSSHHDHSHGHHQDHNHHHKPRRGLHKDWRVWVVVLMLVAMAAYLLSMDESIQPGVGTGQGMPAAPAPPLDAAP
jgi:hypothetical protein